MNEEIENGKLSQKLDELNSKYSQRFWELKRNVDALSPAQYKKMEEVLYTQYMREYELLDGEEGIEVDKQIELLKIKREKELGALRIEHEKTKAAIAREELKQEGEKAVQLATVQEANEIKYEEEAPANLRRRWWQLRARPNHARILAQHEAEIEIGVYFAERENTIAEKEDKTFVDEIYDMLLESVKLPKSRRRRKRKEAKIREQALKLAKKWQMRKNAQAQLDEIIRTADEETGAEAFEEPQAEELRAGEAEQTAQAEQTDETEESRQPKPEDENGQETNE